MHGVSRLSAFCAFALLLVLSGCSDTPYERAEKFYKDKDYPQAARAYEEVLKLKPDHGRALRKLGISQYHMRQYDDAIRSLQRSLAISNHYDTHMALALCYARTQHMEEAIQHWESFVTGIANAPLEAAASYPPSRDIKTIIAKLRAQQLTLQEAADQIDSD